MTDHTSHIADAKRLERSDSDRILAGVAGGLARYFDIHPAFYRVGFVVLTLLGGSGILIYAAAALVMPAARGTRIRSRRLPCASVATAPGR